VKYVIAKYSDPYIDGYECYHLYGNKPRVARRGRYTVGIYVYYKHELNSKLSIVE